MHASIAEVLMKLVLKFSEADILPYDLREFIDDVKYDYVPELAKSFEKATAKKAHLEAGLEQFEMMKGLVEVSLSVVNKFSSMIKIYRSYLIKSISET